MLGAIVKTIFGSSNDRYIKSLDKIVQQINAVEPTLEAMSDEELGAQTAKFREQLAAGSTLDQILPEAFATVREASKRVFGMRHFDVQMIGGIVLHEGKIAEMATGEGKTIQPLGSRCRVPGTLPLKRYALAGRWASGAK
ncbi:MAG: hypothetical protein P8Y58_07550, partial [Novosphingobium sp.]